MTSVNDVSPADYQAMIQQAQAAQPVPEQDMGGYATMPADAYAYEEIPEEKKSFPWLKIALGLAGGAGLFWLGKRSAGAKEAVDDATKEAAEALAKELVETKAALATKNAELGYSKIAEEHAKKEAAAAGKALANAGNEAEGAAKFKWYNPKTWGASSLAKKIKGFVDGFNKEKAGIDEEAKKAKETLDEEIKKAAEEAKKAAEEAKKAAEEAGEGAKKAAEGAEEGATKAAEEAGEGEAKDGFFTKIRNIF